MKLYIKRSLALVLSLLLAFSLLPMGIMAAGTPEIAVGSTTVSPGSGAASISLPVTISNNPGFAGMDLSFSLPEGWVLESISIKEKDDYSIFYAEDDGGDMSALTKPTVNPAGGRFVAAYSEDISSSGYLCWLSITVPADTAVGDYRIEAAANKINTAASTAVDESGGYSLKGGTVRVIESGVILSAASVVADGEKTISATAINSLGQDVTAEAQWSVSPADKGVSVSAGTVTVREGAETGDYVISAEDVGEATLSVYALRVVISGDAVTTPRFTYGISWAELENGIEINEENIKVLTDEPLEGQLSLELNGGAGDKPDAGSYDYEIFFSNADYDSVSVCKGQVEVKPAVVTSPEAIEGLVYSGGAQTGVAAAEGLSLEGSTATDAGSYTAVATPDSNHCWADGGRIPRQISWSIAPMALEVGWSGGELEYNGSEQHPEARAGDAALTVSGGGKNVGSYTAIASTEDKNYSLSNAGFGFRIVPSGEFSDDTTASQRAAVGGVSFTRPAFSGFGGEKVEGALSYTYGGESMGYEALCEKLSAMEKGSVTVEYSFAASGNYTGTKSGSISLELVDLAFSVGGEDATAENAIEMKAEPVFGDSWEDILSVAEGLAPEIAGETLEGEFSFDVSGSPDAGEHKVQLLFNGRGYENVVVCTVAVSVSPAEAEVRWSGESFVYTGKPQAPIAEAVDINGGSLPIRVEGAAADAGSYTARAVCEDKNYILTNAEKAFAIEKAKYEGEARYSPIEEAGKTLADAGLKPDGAWGPGTLLWQDAKGNSLPDSTAIEEGVEYFWSFTPDNPNYEPLGGSVVLYRNGFAIRIHDGIENGSLKLSAEEAAEGDTVMVFPEPSKGWSTEEIRVVDSLGRQVEVQEGDEGFSFVMPAAEVYVSATFAGLGLPFTDVAEKAWYYEPIHYAYYNGLMNGISATKFEPGTNLTRAMMMTILARLAGVDTSGGSPWYEKGMLWAMENGVSDGTNPSMNITREQVVTMLYRYIGEPEVTAKGLEGFVDGDTTSPWAVDAMNWAIEQGLMKGDDRGNVNPRNNATRAEISTIFQRFIENVME